MGCGASKGSVAVALVPTETIQQQSGVKVEQVSCASSSGQQSALPSTSETPATDGTPSQQGICAQPAAECPSNRPGTQNAPVLEPQAGVAMPEQVHNEQQMDPLLEHRLEQEQVQQEQERQEKEEKEQLQNATSSSTDVTQIMPLDAPSVAVPAITMPLPNRAVHPMFLGVLHNMLGLNSWSIGMQPLLTTHVVMNLIKPLTSHCKLSLAEAIVAAMPQASLRKANVQGSQYGVPPLSDQEMEEMMNKAAAMADEEDEHGSYDSDSDSDVDGYGNESMTFSREELTSGELAERLRGDPKLAQEVIYFLARQAAMYEAEYGIPMFGPTTYFVSHAWGYQMPELMQFVQQHWTETSFTGRTSRDAQMDSSDDDELAQSTRAGIRAVYYWLDILAVSQNFAGDFAKHPDSDFPGVIQAASQGLLLTMHPVTAPSAPQRVWCLFEIMTALQRSADIALILDIQGAGREATALVEQYRQQAGEGSDGEEGARHSSKDITPKPLSEILAYADAVDVDKAQATVASDRDYILGLVRAMDGGVQRFNAVLRQQLRRHMMAALLEALLLGRWEAHYEGAVAELLAQGACFNSRQISLERQGNLSRVLQLLTCHPVTQQPDSMVRCLSLIAWPAGRLGAAGIKSLADLLLVNVTLEELNLDKSDVGEEGLEALAPALRDPRVRLKRLSLRGTECDSPACAQVLGEALAANSSLEYLDLTGNKWGGTEEGGMPALFGAMAAAQQGAAGCCTLQHLALNYMRGCLSGAALQGLAAYLAASKHLQTLEIKWWPASEEDVSALMQGVAASTSLTCLDLGFSSFGEVPGCLEAVASAVCTHPLLTELRLNDCRIDGAGLVAVAGALQSPGCKLRILNCSGNISAMEGPEAGKAVADLLQTTTALEYLNLNQTSEKKLRPTVMKRLVAALASSVGSQLRSVSIKGLVPSYRFPQLRAAVAGNPKLAGLQLNL